MDNEEIPKGFTLTQLLNALKLWKDRPNAEVLFLTDSGKEFYFHHASYEYDNPDQVKLIFQEKSTNKELKIFKIE